MKTIFDINDPILNDYKSMKQSHHADEEFFIADSKEVVKKALIHQLKIQSIIANQDFFLEMKNLIEPKTEKYLLDSKLIGTIKGSEYHQNIMAKIYKPKDSNFTDLQGPIICLDGVVKADNVGAIVRNIKAFSFDHLLIDHKTCHPYNRRAVRVSMGNVFSLKIHQAKDITTNLKQLKQSGYKIIAMENRPQAIEINDYQFESKSVFIIGSEGYGISNDVLEISDVIIKIPINENVYALNAASATAITCYQIKISLNSKTKQ